MDLYIENLAWKAFLRSKDPAKDQEDFLQDAQIAILKACRGWNIDGGAAVDTYCITAVINSFIKTQNKERRREKLIARNKSDPDGGRFVPEYFYLKMLDVMSSKGNYRAKELVRIFINKCDQLTKCSLQQLRKASGMSKTEFNLALAELSKF